VSGIDVTSLWSLLERATFSLIKNLIIAKDPVRPLRSLCKNTGRICQMSEESNPPVTVLNQKHRGKMSVSLSPLRVFIDRPIIACHPGNKASYNRLRRFQFRRRVPAT
jgi:hypothetical protein